ncbi:hypothetical protein SxD43FB_22260 [Sphingobium sp. D43FB]|nr:hypothetical protein SxD43FB_22260 [Sphingobium sp. D43FB]
MLFIQRIALTSAFTEIQTSEMIYKPMNFWMPTPLGIEMLNKFCNKHWQTFIISRAGVARQNTIWRSYDLQESINTIFCNSAIIIVTDMDSAIIRNTRPVLDHTIQIQTGPLISNKFFKWASAGRVNNRRIIIRLDQIGKIPNKEYRNYFVFLQLARNFRYRSYITDIKFFRRNNDIMRFTSINFSSQI